MSKEQNNVEKVSVGNNIPRCTAGSLEINKYILSYLGDKNFSDSLLGLSLSVGTMIFLSMKDQNPDIPSEMLFDEFNKQISINIKKGYNYLKECENEENKNDEN